MSQSNSIAVSPRTTKCRACGLVSFAAGDNSFLCPRCGGCAIANAETDFAFDAVNIQTAYAALDDDNYDVSEAASRVSLLHRAVVVFFVVVAILVAAYLSLLMTSEPLNFAEKQTLRRAVAVLENRGFTRETKMLNGFVNFRRTDNWWNTYNGHADAYAATNFPFQVVTLYPQFFTVPLDDTERAAVLLHEAQHLYAAKEPEAFNKVWRARARLGWTNEAYGETKVYRGVRSLTREYAPAIFRCGLDGNTDCTETNMLK